MFSTFLSEAIERNYHGIIYFKNHILTTQPQREVCGAKAYEEHKNSCGDCFPTIRSKSVGDTNTTKLGRDYGAFP